MCKASPALRRSAVFKKHAATAAASCPVQMNASRALQPIELSEPSGSGQSTVGSMSNSFSLSKVEDDKRAILTSLPGDSRAVDFAASKQVNFLTVRRINRRTQSVLLHKTKKKKSLILDGGRIKRGISQLNRRHKGGSREKQQNCQR